MTKKRSDDFHYQSVPGKTKRAFNLNKYVENSAKKSGKTTFGGKPEKIEGGAESGKGGTAKNATITMRVQKEEQELRHAFGRHVPAHVVHHIKSQIRSMHPNSGSVVGGWVSGSSWDPLTKKTVGHDHDFVEFRSDINHNNHPTEGLGPKYHFRYPVDMKTGNLDVSRRKNMNGDRGILKSDGKLGEEFVDEGRALTVAQRLQRGRQIRKIKPKMKRAAKRALTQAPSASRLWKRSERAARTVLKKRFSPVKGVAYAKLTTTQKIYVDRALEKRQKLIRKVAKRLLPKVRAASFKRLQSYRMGTGRSKLRENEAFEAQFNQRPLPQIVESMIVDMGDHPMAGSLMTLLDLAAEKDSPAVKSLKEKAASINVPFAEILQVYADALLEYKRTGSKLSGEQYAFNAVNVYVADQRAPTINEGFMNAFMPPTTMLVHALGSGSRLGPRMGGTSHDHYSPRDKADDTARSKAMHSYGTEVHAKNVTKAGGEPSRNKYKPNNDSYRAKHSSGPAKYEAQAVDSEHAKAKAKFPKEYAVSPAHAFAAHFNQADSLPHLRDKVSAYDKHYRAAKGVTESVSFQSHGEEEDGHHLLWKGEKQGDLRLVSKGLTSGGHRYTLHKANGEPVKNTRGQVLSLTKLGWKNTLHKHFTKQEALKKMRNEESESDAMAAHALKVIQTIGPKHVAGVAKEYAKLSAGEAKNKVKGALTKIRAAAKRK